MITIQGKNKLNDQDQTYYLSDEVYLVTENTHTTCCPLLAKGKHVRLYGTTPTTIGVHPYEECRETMAQICPDIDYTLTVFDEGVFGMSGAVDKTGLKKVEL